MERETKALAAGDFKPALAEKQAQRAYDAGKRENTIGAEKKLSDPNWLATASDNNIRAAWRQAGYTDDVSQYMSRAGRQKLIEMMPAYIAGNLNITAASIAQQAGLERAKIAGGYDKEIAAIRAEASGSQAQKMEFQRLVNTIMANEGGSFEEAAQKIADYFAAAPTAAGSQSSRFKIEPE